MDVLGFFNKPVFVNVFSEPVVAEGLFNVSFFL